MDMKVKRSDFLKLGLLALASGVVNGYAFSGETSDKRRNTTGKTPVIHATDLYHFHCDPDDHWDLATIYALA